MECAVRQADSRHAGTRVPHLAYHLLAIDVHQIDGELHEEGVDRLAGHDPKSRARVEMSMLEEARAPLGTRVGELHGVAEHGTASSIADHDSHGGQKWNRR